MQDDTIICKIRGRARIALSDLQLDDEKTRTKRANHCTGWIVIKQLSDADYLFLYLKDGELRMRAASLNAVELLAGENAVLVRFPLDDPQSSHRAIPLTSPGTVFDIDDGNEYELLKETIVECRMLAEYTLRLQSLAKDVYYAGMYSQLGLDSDLLLDEEFRKLRPMTEAPSSSSSQAMSRSSANSSSAAAVRFDKTQESHHRRTTTSGTQKIIQLTSSQSDNVMCCYYNCNAHLSSDDDDDRQYYLHPYVPKNFQREEMFMCFLCISNWREFREKAKQDNELVLPNEFNEELCAVCSDTPQNLVMCASCPRSFCGGCLTRLLTDDEQDALQESDEWECMCCALDIQHIQPQLRPNLWQLVQIVDREGKGSEGSFSTSRGGNRGGGGRGGVRVKGQGRGQMMNGISSTQEQEQQEDDMSSTAFTLKGKGKGWRKGLHMSRGSSDSQHTHSWSSSSSSSTTAAAGSSSSSRQHGLGHGHGTTGDTHEQEGYPDNDEDDEDDCNLMLSLPLANYSAALLSAEMAANSHPSSSSHPSQSRHHRAPPSSSFFTGQRNRQQDQTSRSTTSTGANTTTTTTTANSMLHNKRKQPLASDSAQVLVQEDTKRVTNIPYLSFLVTDIPSLSLYTLYFLTYIDIPYLSLYTLYILTYISTTSSLNGHPQLYPLLNLTL